MSSKIAKEDVVKFIEEMTVLELSELVKELEEKFGVSAAAPMAMAQAELGFPAEMVRASFDNAIRIDPSSERAKRTLAAFEAANKPITTKIWETRSASAIRTSGLAERRFAMAA